jgi:hypothetical protein
MKSYLHSLIPFLLFLLNHLRLPSPEFDPIPDNYYCSPGTSRYIGLGRTSRKTPSSVVPYCLGVFTDPFHSNRRHIIARVGSRGNMFTDPLRSNRRPIIARVGSRGNMFTDPFRSNRRPIIARWLPREYVY